MNKQYSLIVGHGFSLSNDTDSDPMTDYSPGIWGIKTQKSALKYAAQYLAEGNDIRVTCYDNPRYFGLANQFIRDLGLKQPLFEEIAALPASVVTNGKPSTLGALKKYLQVGTKIRIVNYDSGTGAVIGTRDTFVKQVKTASVVNDKNGGNSHLDFGKASDWSFDNEGANLHWITSDAKRILCLRVEYINQ